MIQKKPQEQIISAAPEKCQANMEPDREVAKEGEVALECKTDKVQGSRPCPVFALPHHAFLSSIGGVRHLEGVLASAVVRKANSSLRRFTK